MVDSVGLARYAASMTEAEFTAKHRTLVWSNSHAEPLVYLRAALLKPYYHILLDACLAFGLQKVEQEWQLLCEDPNEPTHRATPIVERILRNIHIGFSRASKT